MVGVCNFLSRPVNLRKFKVPDMIMKMKLVPVMPSLQMMVIGDFINLVRLSVCTLETRFLFLMMFGKMKSDATITVGLSKGFIAESFNFTLHLQSQI